MAHRGTESRFNKSSAGAEGLDGAVFTSCTVATGDGGVLVSGTVRRGTSCAGLITVLGP